MKNAAKNLAEKIGVYIDLHTFKGAAWSNGKETDYINAFKVEPRRATGAGDCWNAADIVGHFAGLDPRERLTFANAYASSYVRNIYAEPPTMKEKPLNFWIALDQFLFILQIMQPIPFEMRQFA